MCLTCNIIKGEVLPVGGIIYKDRHVILHHCTDVQIPGYLILSPLRHIELYSDLSKKEIMQMGIIMQKAVNALNQIKGIEKVYLANFGEETAHFHMHIFPRYTWMLTFPMAQIGTDSNLDGAKLLSFCRKKYKNQPESMDTVKNLAVIEKVKSLVAEQIDLSD